MFVRPRITLEVKNGFAFNILPEVCFGPRTYPFYFGDDPSGLRSGFSIRITIQNSDRTCLHETFTRGASRAIDISNKFWNV